ncbi:MAG: DoxX family protein [Hyphomonadaceae bacterium]
MFANLSAHAPKALGALRIVTALLYLQHGTQKILSFPSGEMAGVPIASMGGASGLIELVCGVLIALGLLTRPAAFIASGHMAVAYWTVHFQPDNIFPINNGGDLAIQFCFVFLYLVFAGPGAWALDGALQSRKTASA